jgi:O-methyltransferase involved in polyketide biosynthesis
LTSKQTESFSGNLIHQYDLRVRQTVGGPVFEVDHPATQSWKRRRLAGLGVELPARLVFAPVDFEQQTLREGLELAGFQSGQLAVFSWVGVSMYLTLDASHAQRNSTGQPA